MKSCSVVCAWTLALGCANAAAADAVVLDEITVTGQSPEAEVVRDAREQIERVPGGVRHGAADRAQGHGRAGGEADGALHLARPTPVSLWQEGVTEAVDFTLALTAA